MRLGQQLREERERQGKSVRALAARVGVSPSLVSLVENELRVPSPDVLAKWVRALSDDADFRRRAARAWVAKKIGERGGPELEELAGVTMELLRSLLKGNPNAPVDRTRKAPTAQKADATSRLGAVVEASGLDARQLAVIVRLLGRDVQYRELVTRTAELPAPERQRIVDAFLSLLPRQEDEK